jgi:hypothetical protein
MPFRLDPIHRIPPWTVFVRHASVHKIRSLMILGWQSGSEHCVPMTHAKDAAPVEIECPVGWELMPPSEQKDVKAQALSLLQAKSGGTGGGGGFGSGGGGLGNGCCGPLLKAASVTELMVPGPQSVL